MKKERRRFLRFLIYIVVCSALCLLLCTQLEHRKYIKIIYWGLSESEIEQNRPMELTYYDQTGSRRFVEIPNVQPRDVNNHYYESYYHFPKDVKEIVSMKIYLIGEGEESKFKSLEVYQDNLQIVKLAPAVFMTEFSSNSEAVLNMPYVEFHNMGEPVYIEAGNAMIAYMNRACSKSKAPYYNLLFYGVILLLVLCLLDFKSRKIYECCVTCGDRLRQYGAREWLMLFLLISVFVAACVISFGSDFCKHSDEYVTRMAVDYYLGRWVTPASEGSNWLAGTYSPYGANRATECTWYYFFAGKFGWIFKEFLHAARYYRMLNLGLLAGMLCICWNKRKKHPWMYIAACLTPQLWYLFSYATSDAWDYFWGFLVVWMLVDQHSPMNRLIQWEGTGLQKIKWVLLSGFVFSMVLLGKTNYYFVLLLAFMDLLIKWIKLFKERKWKIFVLYLTVLFVCFGMSYFKQKLPKITEAWTGFIQSSRQTDDEVIDSVNKGFGNTVEEHVLDDIQNGDVNHSSTGLRFRDKGFSLYQVMFPASHTNFFVMLFRSSVGTYAINSVWANGYYTVVIGALYLVLYGIACKRREKCWEQTLVLLLLPVFIVLNIAAILYWSWTVDYQPTGRYILPMFLVFGYVMAKTPKTFDSKWVFRIQFLCTILGLYSIWFVGIKNMVM